LSRTKT